MTAVIGAPLPRPDGPIKVRGLAKYSADNNLPGQLHGVFVGSRIAAGRVTSIDSAAALREPGVVRVLTREDMPRFGKLSAPPAAQTYMPMQDDRVLHEGQPVAIVLAETLEAAERAARLVQVAYAPERPRLPGAPGPGEEPSKESGYNSPELDLEKGDIDAGMAAAAHRRETTYVQPSRNHNPMETSATTAVWSGDQVTIHDSVQHGYSAQAVVASALGLKPEQVRVLCPHTGGGFGCKGYVWPHQILIPAAARIVGRPVKMSLSRSQMYAQVGHQAHIRHTVALGVDDGGRLTALRYESVNATGLGTDFIEQSSAAAKGMYAAPAIHTRQRIERCNITLPTAMRAPVEGPGLWALESAMDEMAETLGMDPLDIRLANHADTDPATGRPWSSKKLREAYEEGAALFGWRERPRGARDGHWLIGHGMASCTMGTFRMPSVARVRLRADGTASVEAGFHDIGSGTLTIMPQVAAAVLGLELDAVSVLNGDTSLPRAGPTYGSSSTIGVGAAVHRAAEDARGKLARMANLSPDDVEMRDGAIGRRGGAGGPSIAEVMRTAGVAEVVGDGTFALPGGAQFEAEGALGPRAMRTFGAVFVEVGVDPDLGLLRLRRAVGSYSVGRIINDRTARSQMTGGIIWGWGMAAMEESPHDPNSGRFLSKNLSGVAIPVNADIPSDIKVHFVDEVDPDVGPLGGKGIGEIGATGVAAAVANAVHAATGKRIRELPIVPKRLLSA